MIKQSPKRQIKPRIFIMISALIISIFIAVFFSFNVIIHKYVQTNVQTQLAEAILKLEQHENKSATDKYKDLPDVSSQKKNNIGTHTEVFVLNSRYRIVKHNTGSPLSELEDIANSLQQHHIPLVATNNLKIQTAVEDYYLSIMIDKKDSDLFFIFFAKVTSIHMFVKTVNIILGVIMALALLICFVITNAITTSITNPIKQLEKHAELIGEGIFTPNTFPFSDSEFHKLAETMNSSSRKLEQYDKEQRIFFQNISHELRTPLMSIKCYAEGISRKLIPPQKASDIILSEADNLSDLVEELLCISKIDMANDSLDMREMDLRETLSSCAERLHSITLQKKITFIFDFSATPVLFVYHEKYMERAFNNLLSNALRYAKTTIVLHCSTTDTITISVANDGHCISENDLPYIFDRFYKGAHGNHGIGLSLVKSIVTLHHGHVRVLSNTAQTEFTITFPHQAKEN